MQNKPDGVLNPQLSPKAYRRAKALATERHIQNTLNRNWAGVDQAPPVEVNRMKRSPREQKTKPFVNHAARYKKLARAEREL